MSIVSYQDLRFTSKFYGGLQKALGTRFNFNTAYHPKTNGQTEIVNQILEDMLKSEPNLIRYA